MDFIRPLRDRRSTPSCRFACELVRSGRIGEVKEVYVGAVGGPSSMEILPAEPVPPGLDWDFWLGPAPWRPYNNAYHPVAWRGFYDFSGGGLTDWGAHHFDLTQWALGTDDTGPLEIIPPDGKEHRFLTMVYANGVRVYHVLNDKPEVEMLGYITAKGRKRNGCWSCSERKSERNARRSRALPRLEPRRGGIRKPRATPWE